MKKHKRERSVNFTPEETDLLVSLAETKIRIIESKKNGADAWREKENAWNDIETAFKLNSPCKSVRNHKNLKLKYEAMKRDIRKKSAMIQAACFGNGDSANTVPELTPAEKRVKEILLSLEGNESGFDSDGDLSCSITTWLPAEEVTEPATERTLQDDANNKMEENSGSDKESEPPRKRVCGISNGGDSLQSKPKEKTPLEQLTEEKLEIAKIQKLIASEDLDQKLLHRISLEKDLQHKQVMHELEKQHLLLKIQLLKKNLGMVKSEENFI